MKIAIPLFNNRVSPRFEFAPTLLVATIENDTILDKKKLDLKGRDSLQRTALLRELGVDTLICGGIQGFVMRSLDWTRIQVVSSISGDAEEVIQSFLQGNLCPSFKPCYAGKRCQRRKRAMFGRKKEER